MIRFIIKKEFGNCGLVRSVNFSTLDIDIPELESVLRAGGMDVEKGDYAISELIGVEILNKAGV